MSPILELDDDIAPAIRIVDVIDLEDYLDSLPRQFGLLGDAIPEVFSMWICHVLPSIIDSVREASSLEPVSYKLDDDVMNYVAHENQHVAYGRDKDGLMNILADLYRKHRDPLLVQDVERATNGLLWLKFHPSINSPDYPVDRDFNVRPVAIIWLWPDDVGRLLPACRFTNPTFTKLPVVPDPILWIRIAQKAAKVDDEDANPHSASLPPLTPPPPLNEKEWDVLGIVGNNDRYLAFLRWQECLSPRIDGALTGQKIPVT